jgi:hypothetical protein
MKIDDKPLTAYHRLKALEEELKAERKENYYLRKEVRILTACLRRLDPSISQYGF